MKKLAALIVSLGLAVATFLALPPDVQSAITTSIIPNRAFSGQVLAPDGTTAAPSYSFSNQPSVGIFRSGPNTLGFAVNSVPALWDGAIFYLQNNSAQISMGTGNDLFIARDAANTLAQRNGANAQTMRVYNTYTDAANYERAKIAWSGNALTIGTESSGTGVSRTLFIKGDLDTRIGNGSLPCQWLFDSGNTASLYPCAGRDNTQDIGQPAGLRPRDIVVARHFRSEAATAPTMGACGTSPAVAGSDHGMSVTVGTGGVATSCTVNFGVAFTAAPACVAQNNTDKVAYSVVTAVGSVTVSAAAAFTASSKIYIVCMGS